MFEDKYDLKSSQKLISDIITVFEVTVTTGLEPLTVNRDLVKLIWHDLIQKGQPSSNLTKIKGEEFPVRMIHFVWRSMNNNGCLICRNISMKSRI